MAGDWDAYSRACEPWMCPTQAQRRFVELLNPEDRERAHGMGVWLDDILPKLQEPK